MAKQNIRNTLRQLCQYPPLRLPCNLVNRIGGEIRRHGLKGFFERLPFYLRNIRVYARQLRAAPPAGDARLFATSPTASRDIRLHPDITGAATAIDASVSVVIPTLNAGHEFSWLLHKLKTQLGLRSVEIVVVDSGSSDATVVSARSAGCTVVEIAPTEFSHSYARNTGADAASGDYLLFMVQDAYPIGDFWAYGMLRFLRDHSADNLAAVSCAEYSRSDSDAMYDSIIHNHYRFLGCLEQDRIGGYQGDDHTLLRSYGQLSDVACLIPRALFQRYRYRGSYAEDLDLGIRLIRDGLRVAMLASLKVIHSHNRPAYYYLKRSFVDTIHLVGLFDDYVFPRIESATGLIAGIVSTATHLSAWLEGDKQSGNFPDRSLAELIQKWRRSFADILPVAPSPLGDARLEAFVAALAARCPASSGKLDAAARREARTFVDAFMARLEHFNAFFSAVYPRHDAQVCAALQGAVCKSYAATAGSLLGFMYMSLCTITGQNRDLAEALRAELEAGI
jgi:O-antigen biosynthesis protein